MNDSPPTPMNPTASTHTGGPLTGTLPLLQGVQVIEFCQVAAGPFSGMLLADFGASVTKVEPPEGDAMRQWPPLTDGYSENFASINRGKKSVVLDLKNPTDRDLARALVLEADVLIENTRPGVMRRLGLDWEWFASRKPSLIYCSISAYGQDGPRGAEGGFDLTIQAGAGVMSVTGEPGGAPVKAGVPIADFASGLYAAYAISAMLSRVRAGGPGGWIDVPMVGATIAISALQTSEYFGTGNNPRKLGSAHPRNAPYQAYEASDGWFAIAAGNNKLWQSVCAVVGADALMHDPRFTTPTLRATHQAALKALLDGPFSAQPVAHWLTQFAAAGVPSAPINGYAEALADPQTVHLQLVRDMTLPNGRATRTVGSPIRINGVPVAHSTRPPALGEDTPALQARFKKEGGTVPTQATTPHPADTIRPLREFVTAMTALVAQDPPEAVLLPQVSALMAQLVARDDWLPEAFTQPGQGSYAQYLLHCDPLERFSLVSFVWGPGQHTPIHNHTVWGVIGMLRGAETCEEYAATPHGVQPLHHTHTLRAGDTEAVSPTVGDWHRVGNALTDRPSISIHVYGGNIGAVLRSKLDDHGVEQPFVSGYSCAVLPNLWDRSAAVRQAVR